MSHDERAATNPAAAGRIEARQAHRTQIERQVRARYAGELTAADICDSLRIEVRIRQEIERELAATAMIAGVSRASAASGIAEDAEK